MSSQYFNVIIVVVTFVLFNLLTIASSLRVLGLFPHPAVSHFNAFRPILKELADHGHDVTVLSHFPDMQSQGPNYHDFVFSKNEILTESIPVAEVRSFTLNLSLNILYLLYEIYILGIFSKNLL